MATHCWTLQASHIKRALRRLRPDFSEICLASSGGRSRPSFLQTAVRTLQTWPTGKCRADDICVSTPRYIYYFPNYYYYWDTSCPSCLFCAGQGNSDSQTSAPDWPDNLRGGGRAQDETAGSHILFHRPSQSMLGIFSESVHLRQQNHWKQKDDTHVSQPPRVRLRETFLKTARLEHSCWG